MTRPVITVSTNPRAGELGWSIAGLTLGKAINEISDKIGQRMSAQLAKASGAPLTGGVSLALTSPVDIQVNDFEPLPGGTGNGLSAFYYALLLLLAGFTGSIVVSSLVDSMLGFVPAELGPMYRFAEPVKISRFRTLLVKWGLMVVVAALHVGGLYRYRHCTGYADTERVDAVGIRRLHDCGRRDHIDIVDRGAGLGGAPDELVHLRHAGPAVQRRHNPLGGRAQGVRVAGEVQTDAPGVPRGAGAALLRRPRRRRADPRAGDDEHGLVIGLLIGAVVTRFYDRRGLRRIHNPAGVPK